MSDKIVAIFQFLESSLGMHPATVAANALLLTLAFAFLAVFLSLKLRSARKIVHLLAERLGYEPPYGNGKEIFEEETQKATVDRDREKAIEQLERHIGDLKTEGTSKDANVAALEQRGKGLEEQLHQAALRHDEDTAQAEEQAQAHFEELVQNYLGIRADEFLQRYQRGEYKDVCDDSRLLKIIMMIPKSAFGHK